ncbi:putative dehydrogenase [Arthrobacter stackebrandtii]|uniref:Dehydrogenase n=1 Tax=Arthrobacter stackebrandtii TaxID=272161 RepID=A0ABS4YUW4_9MICC|nr:Gfo/Idh/MocA family oxidoreductase [Arthrobacter stackebrandtii]MBP2412592.1 putative dehydrogenase [Arthrobacter stackebrandtii]PYH02331.1 oxidoreductase [Arthrobacter stackebrandtii]
MTQVIRTALLGYGLAGRVFHAPSLAALPQFSIDVIVASDPGRQAEARRDHPGAAVLSRAEWELRRDRTGIDLVVVATPPASHVPLAEAALEGGCDVVVDKPFALTSAQGEALIALATERGRLLSSYQNRRWDGEFLTLQRLLAEGALGEVWRFESRLERNQPAITKVWKAEAGVADGGGLLFDLGTHLIDQALLLFGPVVHSYGELRARRPMERAEDDVFIALEHASGVISHLWVNANVAQNGPRLRVLGSGGAYVKGRADVQESQIQAGVLPGMPGYGVEPEDAWGRLGSDGNTVPVPTERGNFSRYYELLAAAILDGGPVPVDPADSVAGLRIVEELRAAHVQRTAST